MTENINELLVIGSGMTLAQIFEPKNIDSVIEEIEFKARAFKGDPSTSKGRKEIASMGHMVARSKTFLDSKGKELTQDKKDAIKLVDNERKKIRERLDDLKEEVLKPKTDWELAEQRIIAQQNGITKRLVDLYNVAGDLSASEYDNFIAEVKSTVIDGDVESDWHERATREKEQTLNSLHQKLDARIQHNKDQAELARLREENEKREEAARKKQVEEDRKAREEKIKAEARAQAEKLAKEKAAIAKQKAAKKIFDAKAATEKAKREKIEAAERAESEKKEAVAEAERKAKKEAARKESDRIAKETAEKAAAEKKAANKANRAKIKKESVKFLAGIEGMTGDLAEAVFDAISSGDGPNMSVDY